MFLELFPSNLCNPSKISVWILIKKNPKISKWILQRKGTILKGNFIFQLPNINFQVLCLLVSGRVIHPCFGDPFAFHLITRRGAKSSQQFFKHKPWKHWCKLLANRFVCCQIWAINSINKKNEKFSHPRFIRKRNKLVHVAALPWNSFLFSDAVIMKTIPGDSSRDLLIPKLEIT